jgi:hypothetical protein
MSMTKMCAEPPVDHAIYLRYSLPNLHARPAQGIDNDRLDITIKILNDSVYYRFKLFRLKPKTGEKHKEQFDIFSPLWKGSLDDWYWDYVYYTHCCN